MEEVIISIILFCSIFQPSIASGFYAVFSYLFFFQIFSKPAAESYIYKALIWLSCINLGWKGGLSIYIGLSGVNIEAERYMLNMIGFLVKEPAEFNYQTMVTFLPDTIILTISVLGWLLLAYRITGDSVKRTQTWEFLAITALFYASITSCSFLNLSYAALGLIMAISWAYKKEWIISRFFFKLCSILALMQVGVSYLTILFTDSIFIELQEIESNKILIQYLKVSGFYIPYENFDNVIGSLLIITFSLGFIRPRLEDELADLKSPLNRPNTYKLPAETDSSYDESVLNETSGMSLKQILRKYIPFHVLYLVFRLVLFYWVFLLYSFACVPILLWFFYSIVKDDNTHTMEILPFTLLPYCILYFIVFYIYGILFAISDTHMYMSSYTTTYELGLFIQLFSILFFLLLIRLSKPYELRRFKYNQVHISSVYLTIIVQNSDKLALCVLFAVGLSSINLLHTGFMVYCLVFMLKNGMANKHWKSLMVYTMLVIVIRYVWYLLVLLYSDSTDIEDEIRIYELIGLPYKIKNEIVDWNIILWILLFTETLQLSSYNSTAYHMSRMDLIEANENNKWKLLVGFLIRLYELCTYYQTWIIYTLMYLIMTVSHLNILNSFRFLLLNLFLLLHLYHKNMSPKQGQDLVKGFWFIIEYYSGVLTVLRYVYQFINFTQFEKETRMLNFFGVELYEQSVLYEYMITDCLLLVLSFFNSRMFKEEDLMSQRNEEFYDENVGFLSGLMKMQLKNRESNHAHANIMKYVSGPFNILVYIAVSVIAIFWRLSFSMLVLLLIMGVHLVFYCYSACRSLAAKTAESNESEWNRRYNYWKVSFLFIILFNLLAYFTFIINPANYAKFETVSQYLETLNESTIVWIYYAMGFEISGVMLFEKISGYGLLLLIFIIERHCLEALKSELDSDKLIPQGTLKKILVVFRILGDSLIPATILLVGFYKLTFIMNYYAVVVFIGMAFLEDIPRIICFNIMVTLGILMQYILILSNFSKQVESEYGCDPNDPNTILPWYKHIQWKTPDDPAFLNLGTSKSQLYMIISDLGILLLIHFYYRYFLLSKANPTPTLSRMKTIYISTTLNSCLARFVKKSRKIIYNTTHLFVLGIVLLLITQNTGVILLIYCLFCLLFILRANDFMKRKEAWDNFMKVLRNYFLLYILLDLIMQSIFQLPFQMEELKRGTIWPTIIGLLSLWRAGEKEEPADAKENMTKIMLKITTFTFLYLMYKVMTSKDFLTFKESLELKHNQKAQEIGLEMARFFNDYRIEKNKTFLDKIKKHRQDLEKLENMVSLAHGRNSIAHQATQSAYINNSFEECQVSLTDSCIIYIQRVIIKNINPALFKRMLENIKIRRRIMKLGTKIIDKPEIYSKFQVLEMKKYEDSDSTALQSADSYIDKKRNSEEDAGFSRKESEYESSSDSDSGVNYADLIVIKEKKITKPLDLNFKDYLQLLVYFFYTNSDGLAYFFFFVNHFMYASLESIIFPISVLFYAIIENPRPTPKYWRLMLFYAELVFFVKLSLQLPFWTPVFGDPCFGGFQDPYKIGFNCAQNTYSGSLISYILWDVIVMVCIILHEYYLIDVGLWPHAEYDLETLSEAKDRRSSNKADAIKDIPPAETKNSPNGYIYNPPADTKNISDADRYNPSPETKNSSDADKDNLPGETKTPSDADKYIPPAERKYSFKAFLHRLLPVNKEEKPGRDLYFWIVMIQFMMLIYTFCFYTQMDGESSDIAQSFRANSFSGHMVIALVTFIIIIIFDRFLYLERTSKDVIAVGHSSESAPNLQEFRSSHEYEAKGKYEHESGMNCEITLVLKLVLYCIIIIAGHGMIFWYYPIHANFELTNKPFCEELFNSERCNNFQINQVLQVLYLQYFIYCILTGIQLREGLPRFRKGSFRLVQSTSYFTRYLFVIYRGLPFLFELRTLIDWSLTKTALDLWQWLKFEDIYAELYITKCTQQIYRQRPVGEPIPFLLKFIQGFCGLIALLLIMLMPLIIYSSLNPILVENPVKGMSLEVGLRIDGENYYKLYQSTRTVNIDQISEEDWKAFRLGHMKDISNQDEDLAHVVTLPIYSDNVWDISPPCRSDLCTRLNPKNTKSTVEIWLEYNIKRYNPPESNKISSEISWQLNRDYLVKLNDVVCGNSTDYTFVYREYKYTVIKAPSVGNHLVTRNLPVPDIKNNFMMQISTRDSTKSNMYWAIGVSKDPDNEVTKEWQSLSFIVISDRYSPATFNFSVLTFYISIVYVAGRLLRMLTGGKSGNLMLTEMPCPDPLINLCEGIYLSRMTGDTVKEEQLYYDLIDILRSPEIAKLVTMPSSRKEKIQ